jgi:hypothetical protein
LRLSRIEPYNQRMDRRSIVLLLTLAVLLQPAFASMCMMQCPPLAAGQSGTQPMAGHATHAHHHVLTAAACGESRAMAASGMCDKTVDLRSNALVAPTATPVFTTSDIIDLSLPLHVTSSSRPLDGADRFHAPLVVPLRI